MLDSFVISFIINLNKKKMPFKLSHKLSLIKSLYLSINNYVDGKFIKK